MYLRGKYMSVPEAVAYTGWAQGGPELMTVVQKAAESPDFSSAVVTGTWDLFTENEILHLQLSSPISRKGRMEFNTSIL